VNTNAIANGALTFQIPTNAIQWATPAVVRINVLVQSAPNVEPVSVLQGGEQNFILFNNIAQSEFAYTSTNITFSATNLATNTALTITPPPNGNTNLFWTARQGLFAQLQSSSGQIQLQLANTATTNVATLSSGRFDGTNIQFQLNNIPNIQPITNAFNITNSGQAICNGTIVVPQYAVTIFTNITVSRHD
jgi:hypothetical protein